MPRDSERFGTRRRFLESTAVGGLIAGLVGAGAASGGSEGSTRVAWECDHVALTDVDEAERARVDFRDGSYVESANGVDGDEPVRLGSPGRTVDTVTITTANGTERTLENPSPECSQRRRATEFTATRVHVPAAEFAFGPSVPSVLTTSVTLHFSDGTSQRKQHYSGDGDGDVDDFPEIGGLLETEGMDAVPNVYHGTGERDGTVVEAVEIRTDEDHRTRYLESDCAEACLYGAETAQERIVEVVGTSEGAVRYELTATGPVHRAAVNGKIRAEDDDGIVENDDGTYTVSGGTGNTGYGDSFVVNGEITDFTRTGGDGEYIVRALERRLLDH